MRQQWRWSLASLALLLVALAVSTTARSHAWNFLFLICLSAFLQGWRVSRWQRRLTALRAARDTSH
jgi:hypothetical protein